MVEGTSGAADHVCFRESACEAALMSNAMGAIYLGRWCWL